MREDLYADLAALEATVLRSVDNKLASFCDKQVQFLVDMDAKLEEFHTVAQADPSGIVQRTAVDLLADDEVCCEAANKVIQGNIRKCTMLYKLKYSRICSWRSRMKLMPRFKKNSVTSMQNFVCFGSRT